jgi:hypothetical protein
VHTASTIAVVVVDGGVPSVSETEDEDEDGDVDAELGGAAVGGSGIVANDDSSGPFPALGPAVVGATTTAD